MNFKTFYINKADVGYQEVLSEDPLFEKFYLLENPNQEDIVAIPDGCVDIQFIWEGEACQGYACGSFLEGKRSRVSNGNRCFGVKLRPGVRFEFLESADLLGRRIPLSEFLEVRRLESLLSTESDLGELVETSSQFFHQQKLAPTHIITESATRMLTDMPGPQKVTDVAEALGYSSQYINHIFRHNIGLSMKKYAGIIRAQAAISYLESKNVMDVVMDLGYYDQAHFIRDFKQHTSLTPKHYVEQLRYSQRRLIV